MKRVVAGQFRRCHVIVLIRAVAIWLTTVLFSLAVPSAIVAASPVAQSACPSYSYDAPVYDAPDSSATSGRGPPAQRDALIAYSADCWSCGASARSGGATPCAAAKTACFTAGTPVLLADGTSKPIEDIAVGDKVTAYNPDTGKTETRDVVRTFVHHDVPTYDVTLDTGEKVTTTSEHPFWVEGEGWTPATQLRAGDRLRQPDCTSAEVASVRPTGQTGTVYNFEVAGLHDY